MITIKVEDVISSYCFVSVKDASTLAERINNTRNKNKNESISIDFDNIFHIDAYIFEYLWKWYYEKNNIKETNVSLVNVDNETISKFVDANDKQYKAKCDLDDFYKNHPNLKPSDI